MSRPKRPDSVVKFPIGRVVREHRIGQIHEATPEAEAIEQAARSVRHAIQTLRRQEASLNLRAAQLRKKVTPEQHARLVEKNMRLMRIGEAEDRAAAEPPLDPRQILRELAATFGVKIDDTDGGNAA
jgi:hypothetical protein